jgi:hypothetical protein
LALHHGSVPTQVQAALLEQLALLRLAVHDHLAVAGPRVLCSSLSDDLPE